MNVLLIDQEYLTDRTVIDDNVDYSKVRPEIEKVQNLKIRPLLGTDLYKLILTQIGVSPTPPYTGLSADNKILLYDHLQMIVCEFLLARLRVVDHYRLTNSGTQTRTPEGSQAAELSTIKYLVDFNNNTAEELAQLMVKFLRANPTKYPAYFTRSTLDAVVPAKDAYDCDIFLDEKCNTDYLDPYYRNEIKNKRRPF